MPYSRPYPGGFVDFPSTTTPINASTLNTMDVGIKTANDQFQTVTTAQRATLTPSVGQAVWDSDLRQLMVYMNASGGNAWQPVGNRIVCASTTRPSSPFEGQEIYETDTQKTLVYNGANWIETSDLDSTDGLPSSAQTKLNAVGLTHITTQTFTAASTVSVNNCFSATYQNYKVVIQHTSSEAAGQTHGIRMRVGGVDNSTANSYVRERLLSVSGTLTGLSSTSDFWISSLVANALRCTAEITFVRPFEAVSTGMMVISSRSTGVCFAGGDHNQATSYDGFSIIAGAGTMTGVLRVYGYLDG